MNCLSRRAEKDVPTTPAFPVPTAPPLPMPAPPVVPHAAAVVVGDETVGVAGANELGPTVPATGNTPIVGTAGAELTPRLLISIEPSGIPVRATPPGAIGDVDVGVDEEAMLLEPEPHIPDSPDVCSAADVAEVPDIAIESDMAPVAGVVLPNAMPPPS